MVGAGNMANAMHYPSLASFPDVEFKNREFIDCVKAGRQPGSNFSDPVKTMEVAEWVLAQTLRGEAAARRGAS